MKKLVIVVLSLVVTGWFIWMNRVNLLVWALPKVQAVVNPVAPNRPIEWQAGPATAKAPPDQRPPNIILILADDMGFNDVSLYNGGAADGSVQTPHIDALAQQGASFTNGYAANAVCAPSRATIMTGRYSTRFGFEFTPFPKVGATIFQWLADTNPTPLPPYIDHDAVEALPPMTDLGLPSSEVTIAEALKARGYYTAHIGKWHLGVSDGMHPLDQGFDDSLNLKGLLYDKEDSPNVVNAKVNHSIDKMVWASGGYSASFNQSAIFEPEGYLTDYYTR
ncbi:MAG: sulfatase-like hydrolase/transferase, partial [Pseudomonadales bacterium]